MRISSAEVLLLGGVLDGPDVVCPTASFVADAGRQAGDTGNRDAGEGAEAGASADALAPGRHRSIRRILRKLLQPFSQACRLGKQDFRNVDAGFRIKIPPKSKEAKQASSASKRKSA